MIRKKCNTSNPNEDLTYRALIQLYETEKTKIHEEKEIDLKFLDEIIEKSQQDLEENLKWLKECFEREKQAEVLTNLHPPK